MTIQSIIEFAIGLILLVLIHELGHFGMARLCKIGVEEFGIGIPPRMLTLFEAGGTKFSLNWLPVGGFVRLKGENDPSVPGGFASANPWARIAVLLAGPFANLFAAVVMMIIITGIIGVPDKIVIENVVPNSPAEQAGFMPGDVILSANGRDVHQSDELHDIIYSNLGQPITVAYLRGEDVTSVVIIPRINPPEGEGAVGIEMSNPYRPISPVRAIPLGITATYDQINHLAQFFGQLVSGKVSLAQARPVGIVGMTQIYNEIRKVEPVTSSPVNILSLGFFTTLSISLGILNLLPIPALDGGRILFIIPEILVHKRLPQQYENVINLVGFALLLLLIFFINYQDIINPPFPPTLTPTP